MKNHMNVLESHRIAAVDNAALCAAMWRAHGLEVEAGDGFVACSGPPPPLYPDAVTVDPRCDPVRQARLICKRASQASRPYVVKDSFRALALGGAGFEPLFHASWIRRAVCAVAGETRLDWRPVVDLRDELSTWEAAWGGSADGPPIFLPGFLSSPEVTILAGWAGAEIVAGCVVTEAGATAGVSNIFGDTAEVILAAASAFAGRDLVGYEYGDALSAALMAGFEVVGGLTVWRRDAGA